MPAKNGSFVGFHANPEVLEIIDLAQRQYYTMNKSAVIRMLILAGGEKLVGQKKK